MTALAALIAIAIASLLRAAITAPEGFEDEAGFHAGAETEYRIHTEASNAA